MAGLIFLLLLALLVLVFVRGNQRPKDGASSRGDVSGDAAAELAHLIAGYEVRAKTKAEKQLVQSMLEDLEARGFIARNDVMREVGKAMPPAPVYEEMDVLQARGAASSAVRKSTSVQLDNVSILLYLGAFLFIASVGLFVAFSGFSGSLRTVAVAVVALVLYFGGVWLNHHMPRLAQAGLAFAGIGMGTVPFVGLAAYSFVLHASSGALVWLLTSLVCLMLYAHALITLRRPLLNYVLIFTILSLVESSVSVINAPIYYFGWGLSLLGILMAVLGRYRRLNGIFRASADNSARVFVPLAAVTALLLAGSHGTGQLGVSLLIAAVYYLFEFVYGNPTELVLNAAVAQGSSIAAAGMIAHGIHPGLVTAAVAVMIVSTLQVLAILLWPKKTELATNFASIVIAANVVALFLGARSPKLIVLGLVALIASAIIVWLKQVRVDAYGVVAVAWMLLPLAFGQLYLSSRLSMSQQAYLSLAALAVQFAVVFLLYRRSNGEWQRASKLLFAASCAIVLLVAAFATPLACMIVSVAVAASLVLVSELAHEPVWAVMAGFAAVVPLAKLPDDPMWFAGGSAVALLANLGLALRYRQELTRWLASALWLIFPVASGSGFIGHWTPAEFGWAYLVVCVGFVLARMVARGVVFLSTKTPVASYDRSASLAYVTGYTISGLAAVLVSLPSGASQLHTSLILTATGLLVWWLAVRVERQTALFVLLPLFAQALLLSAFRPVAATAQLDWYLLAAITVALFGYFAPLLSDQDNAWRMAIQQGSLFGGLVAPLSFLFTGNTHLLMPIGLLAFTGMLYHYANKQGQSTRELIGSLGLLGLWWIMWFFGVRNLQAYTHVLALLFAVYAYWRYVRNERAASDQYLLVMLATATLPLILQALSGTAGSIYGWWLLLEQIFFMLFGMVIRRRFVIWWGLFVAVGAVMYQLRHLGWAALTVLALFLIGLAVYLLQKQNNQE